jgi:arabinofuranosyltransferase
LTSDLAVAPAAQQTESTRYRETKRAWDLAVLGLPVVVALLARMLTGPHAIDDAYITFRYARNLAEGLGLVYNPGEWVLGTTAPLWAILLGAGYKLGLTDLPWLATVVSAVCDAGSVALLVRFAVRLGWRPLGAALVGLAWALNPMSIAFATGGMETSLFVLFSLVVLGLATRLTNNPQRGPLWGTVADTAADRGAQFRDLPLAAGLAGLAMLVRPEGALLAAVVVGWTWLSRRNQTWLAALAAATPMAVAGLTIFLRYGSPLPNSVAAKQVAYQPTWPFENAVALLLQAGLPGWSTYLLGQVPAAVGLVLAVLGLGALVELTRRAVPWLQHRSLPWLPFAAFGALYVAFYVVVGLRGVRLFPWYLVPIEPFYLLAAAAGLLRLGALRPSWLAALLVLWQLPAIDWRQPLLPVGENHAREQVMLDVGYGLARSLPSTAVIAAPEIGALGYASNLRILDTVGLVSPVAIPYYPLPREQVLTDNAIPPRLIVDQQPDVVVSLDAFAQRSLLPDPAFQRGYRLERSYPASVWQSEQLLVYRRATADDN